MNLVVGKNEGPKLEKIAEIEIETFDNIVKEMEDKTKSVIPKKVSNNAGYASYVVLGIGAFIVSLLLLWFFVK